MVSIMSQPRNIPSYRPRGNSIIGMVSDEGVRPAPDFSRWLDGLRFRIQESATPAGVMQAYLGEAEPEGWLQCNGQAVSIASFGNLYAIVGDTFGATSTTFTLPDLRDRMLVGANTLAALMATAGASTATLSEINLPAHSHTVTDPGHAHIVTDPGHGHTVTDPGHSHNITDPGHTHAGTADLAGAADSMTGVNTTSAVSGGTDSATTGVTVDSATTGVTVDNGSTGVSVNSDTTGITVQNTGGGEAFSIVPPVLGVNWLIKT